MGVARIYTLATPYAAEDLALLKWAQSADVLTLAHPNYATQDLRRSGHAAWTITAASYGSALTPPVGLAISRYNYDAGGRTETYTYVVTSVAPETADQSQPSAEISIDHNPLGDGGNGSSLRTVTVTWTAVVGAEKYYVYRKKSGLYAFVGTAVGTEFTDDSIQPDTTITPPKHRDPFAAGNNPGVVTYHEQRRFFAASLSAPQTIWATQSGLYYNMDTSQPARASDALTLTIASLEANEIRWLVPLNDLLVFTSGDIWRVRPGSNSDVIDQTPQLKPQGGSGSNHVRPIKVLNSVLYVQEKGSLVRDLSYDLYSDGYVGDDISIMAAHLFEGRFIKEWSWQEEPSKVLWTVMSDGAMLGLTYMKKQEVYAWHRHATDGLFESVCTITEGGKDILYFVVKRTVDGMDRRYVERMAPRVDVDVTQGWFVDCGVSYSGAAKSTFSGLDHLEGKTVSILADGAVKPAQVVTGGAITIDHPATMVIAGLPYVSEIETLPLDLGEPTAQGKRKRVCRMNLRVSRARGLSFGASSGDLREHKDRTTEAYGVPPTLFTGDIAMNTNSSWEKGGQTRVQQTYPLPCTILSIAPEIDLEG